MRELLKLLREEFNLPEEASLCFTDIRVKHEIPLWHVIVQVFLVPFFRTRSFLELDIKSRLKEYKRLFRSKRKMVSSDTTVLRILRWLSVKESRRFLLNFLEIFEKHNVLTTKLVQKGRSRRYGIIDGSCMGGHWISCLTLSGKINLPILIKPYENKGKELNAAHILLEEVPKLLRDCQPDVYLLDALYFNTNIFKRIVHDLKSNLIIKCRNSDFREVLKDAKLLFEQFEGDFKPREGYDRYRMCSWRIQVTQDVFADIPIQIIKVNETYSKKNPEQANVEFYAVCTDMTMDVEEIREAAHYRWQIENNVFKRLNEHCGTKRVRTSHSNTFLNWIHLLCLGTSVFDLSTHLLKRAKESVKKALDGRKMTWKNIQSVFEQELFNRFKFI